MASVGPNVIVRCSDEVNLNEYHPPLQNVSLGEQRAVAKRNLGTRIALFVLAGKKIDATHARK